MNETIEVKPGDGPLTLYVVAVLFRRQVAPSGTWGTGFSGEEVLLAHQFTRPGESPLSKADATQCGIDHIRRQWAKVMGPQSDASHFAVARANTNATVLRPAPPAADLTSPAGSSGEPKPAAPVKRKRYQPPPEQPEGSR